MLPLSSSLYIQLLKALLNIINQLTNDLSEIIFYLKSDDDINVYDQVMSITIRVEAR